MLDTYTRSDFYKGSVRGVQFEIVHNEITHIAFNGRRQRHPTVLIRVGGRSLSKKAFLLGAALVVCQILDGLLTYIGLSFTTNMEGNRFLSLLMEMYGVAPALMIVKCLAVVLVVVLTWHAHRRRWMRPVIFCLIALYFVLAIVPWTGLISHANASGNWGDIMLSDR